MAARFDGLPWHEYRRLPAGDRAEILATFQEYNLREGIHQQRLKAKEKKDAPRMAVEEWLG